MNRRHTAKRPAVRRGVIPLGFALLIALPGLLCLLLAPSQAQDPVPTISWQAPPDVDIPSNFPPNANPIKFFDDFSWRLFVALCWPAQAGSRGVPDSSAALGDASARAVWDTYKVDWEVFQPNGAPPTHWGSFDAVCPDAGVAFGGAGQNKVIGSHPELSISPRSISDYNQAGVGKPKGCLVSKSGQYVRYEILFNEVEFSFIQATKTYLASNLPVGDQLLFPFGSIELKAAWVPLTANQAADPAVLARYYTRDASLVDPKGGVTSAKIALIGLHIVAKTPSRREWIWSSFEHVGLASGTAPVLLDGTGATSNVLLPPISSANMPKPTGAVPTPVSRLNAIHADTAATNVAYRTHPQVAQTVWANYQLVMTQWPTTPAKDDAELKMRLPSGYPTSAGNPFPGDQPGHSAFANLCMETSASFQTQVSCMECHAEAARMVGTEFVWAVGLRAWRTREQTNAFLALRTKIISDRWEWLDK